VNPRGLLGAWVALLSTAREDSMRGLLRRCREHADNVRVRTGAVLILVLGVVLGLAVPASAQLNTQHLKGGVGLKPGSTPPQAAISLRPSCTSTRLTRLEIVTAIGSQRRRTSTSHFSAPATAKSPR